MESTPAPRWLVSGTSSDSPGPSPIPLPSGGCSSDSCPYRPCRLHQSLTHISSPGGSCPHPRQPAPSLLCVPSGELPSPQPRILHASYPGQHLLLLRPLQLWQVRTERPGSGNDSLTPVGTIRSREAGGGGGGREDRMQGKAAVQIGEMQDVDLSTDFG